MPAPTIILQKPYILVSSGGSQIDGAASGAGITFGSVVDVYDTCDMYADGDSVLYLTDGQIEVNYAGTNYVIIEESKIINKEVFTP